MIYLITGACGSGKSEYAEGLVLSLQREYQRLNGYKPSLVYLATMFPYDQESHNRIKRHRELRRGKGFTTLERCSNIAGLSLQEFSTVESKPILLLECLSNLAANELYLEEGAKSDCVEEILRGITKCAENTLHIVIVTNEIFSDGIIYTPETMNYIQNMGDLNTRITAMADEAAEVFYGIPISIK